MSSTGCFALTPGGWLSTTESFAHSPLPFPSQWDWGENWLLGGKREDVEEFMG